MKSKIIVNGGLWLSVVFYCSGLYAQDPLFTQFYALPVTINPALTGNGSANWRLAGIHRAQWLSSNTDPLTSTGISIDGKIIRQNNNDANYVGGGLYFLQEKGLGGAYKQTSFNLATSGHISLDADDANSISVGLGGTYSNTYIDFEALNFSSQISSTGLNRSLPTAEPNLFKIPPYLSLFGGIAYSFSTETMGFDIGVSGYRFMKTYRSVLGDTSQFVPSQFNIHANYQTYLSEKLVLNANGIYAIQGKNSTYIFGANIGTVLSDPTEESPTILNTGLWYRKQEAIVPYIGISYGNITGGLTYEIPSGASAGASNSLKTFELSLILRSPQKQSRPIPCPWK